MASATEAAHQNGKLHALLVEDNPLDAELVVRELERDGFEVSSDVAQTEEEFKQNIAAKRYDVILADYNLPQWCGLEAIEIVRKQGLDIPVILVTGLLGELKAVECIKRGVTDYVLKDRLSRLPASVRRALEGKRLRAQRKQAEAALQESQSQLEAIIQSAMDAIITIDEQQCIVLFNAAAEKMFRCSAAEVVGQSINHFIPQRCRAAHTAHIQHFGVTGTSKRSMGKLSELRAVRNDGEEFPMEASVSRTQVGARQLFTVILRDVTERKRAEEALEAERRRSESVLDHLPEMVCLLTPAYDVVFANRAFRKEFGEAQGRKCYDYCFGRGTRCESCQSQEVLQSNATQEWDVTTPEGRLIHILSIPFTDTNGLPLILEVDVDITERKLAEAVLASKAEELARSNRELEQFAYVASHDLQEPLRMVASYTQLLAEHYRGRLDENADKYIGYAVEGALRMQALVQDLLAFSRVGRDGCNRTKTDCNAVVDEALQNLRTAVQESGALVHHESLPPVAADRSQLVQLFQNLIGNAIKFRGKEAPRITVSAEKKGRQWVFAVTDNGIGVAPEHKDVIFLIFQRLHTRAEYPGNGVGLAICKKIVEQHGGRIWVDSEPGQGATFQFTFPAELADEKETQP